MNSKLVSFAGCAVNIDYEDGRPAEIIDFLFYDAACVTAEETANESVHRLRLADNADRQLRLYRDAVLLYKDGSAANMASILMFQVCYLLIDENKQSLLVHSAGVCWYGRGIIFPGHTGAGKSTLTTWLITRGADYLTDELVYISECLTEFKGFSRPIGLKGSARDIFRESIERGKKKKGVMSGGSAELLSPRKFKELSVRSKSTLDIIIFPEYHADGNCSLQPLSKAKGSFKLVKCLANGHNLTEHGLSDVVSLAKSISMFQLNYDKLDQAEQLIKGVLK